MISNAQKIIFVSAFLLFVICTVQTSHARPVSYPGGWTLMIKNDVDTNSAHAHYTLNPKNSIGYRHEYHRGESINADFLQHNTLLKRWNAPNAQANLYLKSGAGIAYDDGKTRAAAFTGLAVDWEDRRFFTSYENRFFTAGNLARFAKHKARIGVAPYVGDYGDLHTWLMLQADYDAGEKDSFSAAPLVRFFKGSTLIEAGYNLDDGAMLNFIQRF